MILFKETAALKKHLKTLKEQHKEIGFVPTMGALHEGHISLIKSARENTDIVICSIFVNPTQFNDPKDLEKYPVTLDQDILLLEENQTDILFFPSVKEIYPDGKDLKTPYALGYIETILEGAARPGHFQGVAQVVDRLLAIIEPDTVFMGQKDYQQIMVIRKMIELKKYPVEIFSAPIKREISGLAISSRNMRLTEQEKKDASAIYTSLLFIKENYGKLSIHQLQKRAAEMLTNSGFHKIDYIAFADVATLNPITEYQPKQKIIILIAAFMDEVRLIDNLICDV